MKIKIVRYMEGEARFVLEEFPDRTFCVKLEGLKTLQEVKAKLKLMLPKPDTSRKTYDDLNIANMKGEVI